ncbi:helix-turn-helix transcriptional regulator [Corynebacterium sp. Q4381]|uniref:helix-turn-helix domain-containing protein n=1 Tax=Corynebacterium sp. Marseille-Q4381 TaxID=3121597 RepID=UPI002FE6A095
MTRHLPRHKEGKPASDNETLIKLGEQIATTRRDSGRLQQEVADAAGVSRSTLHTIEHGGAGVRWEKVVAVADALGLEVGFNGASSS